MENAHGVRHIWTSENLVKEDGGSLRPLVERPNYMELRSGSAGSIPAAQLQAGRHDLLRLRCPALAKNRSREEHYGSNAIENLRSTRILMVNQAPIWYKSVMEDQVAA